MSEHKPQDYKGNGKHVWEQVVSEGGFFVHRLRVPGGYLYRDQKTQTIAFVPLPPVAGHPI